ncbi:M20/M25/M40 family metallo-hydrolase [Desulfosporosinus sp. BICA1-9]|uniref:M20/M25/M40 family metallo-hydrolase n=1 Tax=Desulfosporosinus sp. BICA1-9 TaxID=1531958 RepID=UPI00054B0DA3|nr:M20/M25/M40 family metallo-hydrolase [Desulfosporosinus sp. BICA1-9]KJS47107.1 MAG: peptidase M20 [Peptococcaceae bacterium BRH_c23]KJS84443.1 MAG: peptidase M20 [Desulfosporosinus sp. BICA1-9]HBW39029.1 peptidase M20 [Desulfosporosinus sp.]
MINRERLLAEFFELIKIDSPTRNEREIADVLKNRLESLGLSVREDNTGQLISGNCGNVIAYLKGNLPKAPTILLSAHMDTVDPCLNIEPVLHNGVITSAKSTILGADDKSGIAPILEAIRVIREKRLEHGDLQVIFSVAEEGGLNGAKNLDKTLLQADVGFILDCVGGPGEIVLAAPGQDRLNVTIKGKASHAGAAPEEGISAIVVAAKAIASMPTGRIDEETTANIGTIQGGRATNIVADWVEITCESRSRDLGKLESQTDQMCGAFRRCAEEMGAVAEIEVVRLYDPFTLREEAQVAVIASQAAKNAGLKVTFGPTGGGSDANYYNLYGVPCVVLGTGMQKPHTTEESIAEEDLYRTATLVVEIIKAVAKVEKC